MRKGTIILVLLALAAIGAAIGYLKYNEKTPTASDLKADVSVDAKTLFNAFNTDEAAAGKTYIDKVIEVTGEVREVSSASGGPVNVLLETGDALGAVVCEFAADEAPAWQKGAQVKVKGFCAGFNMDVLLQRCAAVE